MKNAIAVVIPTKDRKEMLLRVISSHLRQPEVGEIVVVVDGSTDGTWDQLVTLAYDEPRIVPVLNPVNRGTPFTKNRGIATASLPMVFVGEDDVEVTDGFFATLLAHRAELGCDLICGRNIWRYVGEPADAAVRRKDHASDDYENLRTLESDTGARLPGDQRVLLAAAPILGPAEVFRTIGFDERYRGNFWREETDFQIAAQSAGYSIGSCPHAVCFNYVIPDDRSGSHASAGLRRLSWIARNNWAFARKHRDFLAAHTEVGHPALFTARVIVRKAMVEVALPAAVRARARVGDRSRRPRQPVDAVKSGR